MLKVNSTEVQNNLEEYLMLAQDQDIIITCNGRGVQEYWIVDPHTKAIAIYAFTDHEISTYVTFKAPEKARSTVFPDLIVVLESVFRSV